MFIAIPPRKRPEVRWVTPVLTGLLALAFLAGHLLAPTRQEALLHHWSTAAGLPSLTRPASWLRPITGLLLHADWGHLLGNLAFLLIFGLPAERLMGAWRFFLLFFAGGASANLIATLCLPQSHYLIGASSAVSAVLGAWIALFPGARLGVVLPLGVFLEFIRAPAALLIGLWVLLQIVLAYASPTYGQIAWVAHLAGFCFGGLYALLSRKAIARRIRSQQGY